MVDAAVQRSNMVESQVLPSDVTDQRIVRAMRDVARERFVPGPLAPLAYMDEQILISGAGQERRWLLAPRLQAKLLQLADIGADAHVLDVGSATGYSAALVALVARSVIALESNEALLAEARANLSGLGNTTVAAGSLDAGWPAKAPYDAIIVEGAVGVAPEELFDQLKDGGRLVAVVTEDGMGRATIWRRLGRSIDARVAFDAAAPLLPGFAPMPAFIL
jgi:protein-L-isoaspartate(D-aspartate) O-methyltransferase